MPSNNNNNYFINLLKDKNNIYIIREIFSYELQLAANNKSRGINVIEEKIKQFKVPCK